MLQVPFNHADYMIVLNNFIIGGFKTFAVFRMQSVFFWEFPRRLKFKSRRFGTQCRFHRPGRSGIKCVEAR